MMEEVRIVIVAYKPFPSKEKELADLMRMHLTILRQEGLVSNNGSTLMRAEDGTIIEVFEWKSKEAIASAHNNPAIQKMWQAYAEVCEYIPLVQLPEANNLFAEFAPF